MHTADNHIGMEFRNQPELRDKLKQERLDALKRIVEEANKRNCNFLVVAGDLFQDHNVAQQLVKNVVEILREFIGEVLVVPGNHDYYHEADAGLWTLFKDKARDGNIHLLIHHSPETFHAAGKDVHFYPCCCPSRHGEEHVIGWVADCPKAAHALHIGIAHGNVEGLGRDDEGRYFNMTPNDLRAAGVDCWLLGHIHAPSPEPGYVGGDLYFMPGTHTPEHIKRTTQGYAWFIEIEDDMPIRFERFRSGKIRFERVEKTLNSEADIGGLSLLQDSQERDITVLDLKLNGRLSSEEIISLNSVLENLRNQFLYLSTTHNIIKSIDSNQIRGEFPDNTYPHELLTQLTKDPNDVLALQLAYDLIKKMTP